MVILACLCYIGEKRRWYLRKVCSGCPFATVLSQSLTKEQTNSVKLTCSMQYYKICICSWSVQANVLFEADVSRKKAFLRNKGKQIWGIKGQLKSSLSARHGILIFAYLCKIILNVFFSTTDKAYSNHCLKKMNGRLPKSCNMEKILS